jgi:preprotein translocase subunit Sec63
MKHDPDFMDKINKDLEARKAAALILGVSETADSQTLKKAYKEASIKYHPDHNGNTAEANQRFILVKCAYELLAFDTPCDLLLKDINSWPGVPQEDRSKLDNPWGHFLWWREKFF